jgi:dolichyl-diphosphooligosaccharide--protein glycosyltransferase
MAKSSSSTPSTAKAATSSSTASTGNTNKASTTSSSPASDETAGDNNDTTTLYSWAWLGAIGYIMTLIIYNAYRIRMGAIEEFGPVIHEFDPYFNYRATEVRH